MKKSIVCILIAILAIAMFVSCDPGIKTTREVKRLVFFDEGTRGTLRYTSSTSAVFSDRDWNPDKFDWYYIASTTDTDSVPNNGAPVSSLTKVTTDSNLNAAKHLFYVGDEYVFEIFGYEKWYGGSDDNRIFSTDTDYDGVDSENAFSAYPIFHAFATVDGGGTVIKMKPNTELNFNVEFTDFGKCRYYKPIDGKCAKVGFSNFSYTISNTDLYNATSDSDIYVELSVKEPTSTSDNFNNVGYLKGRFENGFVIFEDAYLSSSDLSAKARFAPGEDPQELVLRVLVPNNSPSVLYDFGNEQWVGNYSKYGLTTVSDLNVETVANFVVLAECDPLNIRACLHNNLTTWLDISLAGYGKYGENETVTSLKMNINMSPTDLDGELLYEPPYNYVLSDKMFANPAVSFTTSSNLTTATIYLGEGFTTESDFGIGAAKKGSLVFGLCVYGDNDFVVSVSGNDEGFKYVNAVKSDEINLVIDSSLADSKGNPLYNDLLSVLAGEDVEMSIDIGLYDEGDFYTYGTYEFVYNKSTT